jgi:hypothetical protein
MKCVITQIRFLKAPLRERAKKTPERKHHQAQMNPTTGRTSSAFSSANVQQDWTEFQGALTILGCTSVLHRSLQAFEAQLRARLTAVRENLFCPGASDIQLIHQG